MEQEPENSVNFTLKSSDFKEIVGKTSFAMAQQDVRYYLNGLYIYLSNQDMFGVATDGYRLAKSGVSAQLGLNEKISAIIPRKGVIEIDKQLEEANEDLSVVVSKKPSASYRKRFTSNIKAYRWKIPDYEKVIP